MEIGGDTYSIYFLEYSCNEKEQNIFSVLDHLLHMLLTESAYKMFSSCINYCIKLLLHCLNKVHS